MKYIVQDDQNKKMFMEVVGSMPQLPDSWTVLGLADDLVTDVQEIEANIQIDANKAQAHQFLAETDWKVLRHRDQVDMGAATSMTAEEFSQLLIDRQIARDSI